ILILTNNCNDDSYSVIKEYQTKYPALKLQMEDIVFSTERANIGTARRFLMDMALNRFASIGNTRGIIASTDGDTRVDEFWLSETLREIRLGCDVVGGQIITEIGDSPFLKYHLLDIRYHNLIAQMEHLIDPQAH